MAPALLRTAPVLLIALCAGSVALAEPPAEPAAEFSAESTGGLPAWEEPFERLEPGKADEWDDYREAHPDWFGVTAPPVVPVRPYAEYEPSQAVMLRPSGKISAFHKGILKGLVGHVDRIVLFHTPGQEEELEEQIASWGIWSDAFELVDVGETNANWTRDYGPLANVSLADGRVGLVDFRYYHGRAYDDAIPTKLAQHWGINVFRPSMSYEGGNFMAAPDGTCYATEKIYSQNGGHTKAEVDLWMKQYLGCTQMVIYKLPKGLGTGHVDMFSKLMDETHVLLGRYDPALQPGNAAILDDNEKLLEAVVTQSGGKLEIFRLPLPWDETGVWYTYTNSLIVNDTVLVPVYSKFKDLEAEALSVYADAAPNLEIWTVNSDSIIPAGGAIHCVTQTVPDGKLEAFQDPPPLLCPKNEIDKCADTLLACGGLPAEGQCVGDVVAFCGADGYPHEQACDSCCGWDAGGLTGDGWYDCLPAVACSACADACAKAGEAGCSLEATHSWVCTESQAGCLDRVFSACEAGQSCDAPDEGCQATAPCTGDQCPPPCPDACEPVGSRRCSEAGLDVEACLPSDAECPSWVPVQTCEAGLVCFDGVCGAPAAGDDLTSPEAVADVITGDAEAPGPGGDGCGCTLSPPRGNGWSGAWVVMVLVGLALALGRRRIRV
jgi:agmatine deiminase